MKRFIDKTPVLNSYWIPVEREQSSRGQTKQKVKVRNKISEKHWAKDVSDRMHGQNCSAIDAKERKRRAQREKRQRWAKVRRGENIR